VEVIEQNLAEDSMAAIEPAIVTLPITRKLMIKVSKVPVIRPLIAFMIDRACVSLGGKSGASIFLP
jgi:hypothetical protein